MAQREIKFRAYSNIFNEDEMFYDVELMLKEDGYWWTFNNRTRLYQSGNRCAIMQFTGLHDKNGKEIYEGDIMRFYTLEHHTQQSHADINPEIDTFYLKENLDLVTFKDGAFCIESQNIEEFGIILPLKEVGLDDILHIREMCNCQDEDTTDYNGNEIKDSVLGIEVIGNIYENPELLK